jgi:hypothetical protein
MRAWDLVMLAVFVAGCSSPGPPAPQTEQLVVTFSNQADREFGDLLDETLSVTYTLWDGDRHVETATVTLDPGQSERLTFDVEGFDPFTLESRATSPSGTASGSRVTFDQETCGHRDVVHLDARYYAKLTAGSWSWGGDFDADCP